jgi:hypothetical protein
MSRPYGQLDAEMEWLHGKSSLLGRRGSEQPSGELRVIVQRVDKILRHSKLANFLRYLEKRNIDRLERSRNRREAPLLLGPQLFHIFHSVEARQESVKRWPALDRPPAELRAHFEKASIKAKALARLLRKAPQPTVTLAASDKVGRAAGLFQGFPTIRSPTSSRTTIPLDTLLDRAAAQIDLVVLTIGRARRHKQPAGSPSAERQKELRLSAASFLVQTFDTHLGRPHFNEVALITSLVSSIETDAEYVKAVEGRRRSASRG